MNATVRAATLRAPNPAQKARPPQLSTTQMPRTTTSFHCDRRRAALAGAKSGAVGCGYFFPFHCHWHCAEQQLPVHWSSHAPEASMRQVPLWLHRESCMLACPRVGVVKPAHSDRIMASCEERVRSFPHSKMLPSTWCVHRRIAEGGQRYLCSPPSPEAAAPCIGPCTALGSGLC